MPLAEFESESFWKGTVMAQGARMWVDAIVPGMRDVTPQSEPEPEPEPEKAQGRTKKGK